MTDKRDSKNKPKKDERPKVKKEKLKDLDAKQAEGDQVKGGAPTTSYGAGRGGTA